MNRSEIVDAISSQTGATKADTNRLLTAFTQVVEKNIRKKDGVRIVGFGTFKVSKRKAKVVRNPQTGDEIKIQARTVPVFRPGKWLRESVKKGR